MKKVLLFVLASLSMALSGCYTTSMLEKRGFMSEGFMMPPELGNAPDNPAMVVRISPLADGVGSGMEYGARSGADVGSLTATIGGGDPLSALVGIGVGVVTAGVGAIAGAMSDGKVKKAAQSQDDLYAVLLLSAYFLDPESPMTSKEIERVKRHGQGVYVVRFDRKDVNYTSNDFIVLKETDDKIAGRRIYRAIDIFDAKPGDTHSKQFLGRVQDIARKAGVNKRGSIDSATAVAQ